MTYKIHELIVNIPTYFIENYQQKKVKVFQRSYSS